MSISMKQFVECLADSGLLSSSEITSFQNSLPPQEQPKDAEQLARGLIQRQKLTKYQASMLLQGRTKGLVLGNYVVLDKIGQGGMGMVFKARHQRMDRVVALKVLPPSWMKSDRTVQRFHQEAKAAAKLTHPNIVTAFDADEAGGVHFLVMEYVEGRELLHVVKERGPLPVEEAIAYILQAARGLDYAHKKGVVHRDVKPANLLLSSEGTVKILDMGLARLRGESPEQTTPTTGAVTGAPGVTQAGLIIGTLEFLAPEQADDARSADHRADIYSLGGSLFYLLTGKVPFSGQTVVEKVMADRDQAIPSLRGARPEVTDRLDSVFQRMLAKRLEDRYQSMSEVIRDIEDIMNESRQAVEASRAPAMVALAPGAIKGRERLPHRASPAAALRTTETTGSPTGLTNAGQPAETYDMRSPLIAVASSQKRLWLAMAGAAAIAAVMLGGWAIANRTSPTDELAQANPIAATGPKQEPTETNDANSVVAFPREHGLVIDREAAAAAVSISQTSPISGDGENETPHPAQSPPSDAAPPAVVPPRPKDAASSDPVLPVPVSLPAEPPAVRDSSTSTQTPTEPPDKPSVKATLRPEIPHGPDPTYSVIPATANKSGQAAFEKLVREMLEVGWTTKALALKSAEERYKSAHELCPDDPRATYAFGLVQLKHNKYEEATKQFDAVGEQAKPPYLPAFRAAIWLRVLKKTYEPATVDLINFTRAWRLSKPEPPPDWVQSELVIWTGRMVGYLDGPVDTRSLDALAEKCSADIGGLLSQEQWELFKTAKNDVLDEYAAKAGAQEKARMEAKRQQQKESEETKARVAEQESETKKDKKQVEKTAEELEKGLKEQLFAMDSPINGLARDYDRLDARARSLSSTISNLDQQIASLINQRSQLQAQQNPPPSGTGKTDTGKADTSKSGTGKTGTTKTLPPPPSSSNSTQIFAINATIDQLNRDKLRYQTELDRLEIQARDVQRQGNTLISRRQALINDYQTATGKLYKEKESLTAKEKLFERKKQEASKPATGSTGQVKALGQTAKALRTYVDLNLELEKQRVLDSFAKHE